MKKIIAVFFIILFKLGYSQHALKIINHEKIKNLKYVSEYEITLDQGRFPKEEFLLKIVKKEIEKNPNFENYFIHFYLPEMKYGAGAYAVSNTSKNKIPKVEIIKFTLMDYSQYSNQLKIDKDGNYYIEDFTTK